jgi:hypothetical protein
MALIERNRDYEILIRISEDGSVGSHYVSITEIVKDGVVINASLSQPIALGEVGGTTLNDKLGEISANTLISNASLTAQVGVLTSQIDDLGDLLKKSESDLEEAENEISRLQGLLNESLEN